MTPDRWQELKVLFDRALALAPAEREEFLTQSCAGDEQLRHEVDLLLKSHSEARDFIEQPAAEKIASVILERKDVLAAGQRIAHYEIIRSLGSGGMGEVYLAQDTKLRRKVALKLLPAELVANEERLQRFEQEARAASALNHPNILTIYEIGTHDGLSFIATEFIDGLTWRDKLRDAALSLGEILDVTSQVALALSAAHQAGIVHRDIKPENVMLRGDGIVKVLDFGLAKTGQSSGLTSLSEMPTRMVETSPGVVMGTVKYMSPEQARGKDVDARSDIWSLGVMLYEALAGRPPFAGETPNDVIAAILMTEPPPLQQSAPNLPDELQRIIRKSLTRERDNRYQTARDLMIDLKELQQDLDVQSAIERRGGSISGSASLATSSLSSEPATLAAASGPTSLLAQIKKHQTGVFALTALFAIVLAGVAYVFRPREIPSQLPPTQRILSRLTFDPGLQSEPTWSPDGHFIAYSSDRSGNFDIWVQPVGEGNPVQVTKSTAHDWQPDWSSDGKRMVFRSERDGGGLFVTPAPTGGNERKISSFGYRPSWSPDGTQVLFYSANLQNTPSPPKLYLVGMDGGPPREVLRDALSTHDGTIAGGLASGWEAYFFLGRAKRRRV